MKRQSIPLFEVTSKEIFSSFDSWQGLVDRFSDLRLDTDEAVHVAVVGSRTPLSQLLKTPSLHEVKEIRRTESLSLFFHQLRGEHKKSKAASRQFLVAQTGHPFVSLVLYIGSSDYWREGVLPLIESLYPKAAFPFLTQKEMQHTLGHLQKSLCPQGIRIVEFSSKKRLPGTARKMFQSVREWTDADLDTVFSEARDANIWFRSIKFDIVDIDNTTAISTGVRTVLSKYGYFSCRGRFEFFARTLVRQLVEMSAKKLAFFSDRDRLTNPNHDPKPIKISFDRSIFVKSEQIRKLTEVMKRFRHGTCTVLHSNPYMHVSIVDNIDYSSADVWVLSQEEIIVVPQLQASASALKRIVNHIFENFREGEISDVKEQYSAV